MVNGFSAGELLCMAGLPRLSLLVWRQRTDCYHSERHQQQYIWGLHQHSMVWVTFTYLIPNFSCPRKKESSWFCVRETRNVRVLLTRSRSYDLPIVSLLKLPPTNLKKVARRSDIGFFNLASSWGYFWSQSAILSQRVFWSWLRY